MSLSNHVSLTITQDSVGVARAGFGVPLILSATAAWAERVRFYSSLSEVDDDFAAGTPEYRAASAIFSQSPHPEQIAIGRSALPPTQKYTIAATARNSHAYSISVELDDNTDATATYTSDSSATLAEIHNGLLTALNAVAANNYIAAFAPLVFSDITFQGEADDDTLTFGAAHGLETGDGPVRVSGAGLPTGLSAGVDYWVVKTSATVLKLATSLANALAGTVIDLTTDGSAAQTLADVAGTVSPTLPFTVTADAAGDWFSLQVEPADLDIAQTHADPGIATDLADIQTEDDSWYFLVTLYNSNAYVLAAAAWIQTQKKMYLVAVNESDAVQTAAGNSDTLDDLETLEYSRVAGWYHPNPSQFLDAAIIGRCAPLDPGSETWKFKSLSGVTATTLTSTQRSRLIARNANFYQTVAGVSITQEGTTSDGDFIDVQRFIDWLEDDMTASVFEALAGANKIAYTDAGVAVIEAEIRGSLRRGIARGGIAEDPAPVITVPLVADVSSGNKALRLLPDVKFTCTLAGAIHKVTITGVVSV